MYILHLCLMRMRNRAHLIQSGRKFHKAFLYKTLNLVYSFFSSVQCVLLMKGYLCFPYQVKFLKMTSELKFKFHFPI